MFVLNILDNCEVHICRTLARIGCIRPWKSQSFSIGIACAVWMFARFSLSVMVINQNCCSVSVQHTLCNMFDVSWMLNVDLCEFVSTVFWLKSQLLHIMSFIIILKQAKQDFLKYEQLFSYLVYPLFQWPSLVIIFVTWFLAWQQFGTLLIARVNLDWSACLVAVSFIVMYFIFCTF